MLTLTDNAAAVIRDLTTAPQVPDGAGLRIATDPGAGALTLSLTPQPMEGDEIVDSAGALVFLDAEAVPLLDDKALDAAVDEEGSVQFTLGEQLD